MKIKLSALAFFISASLAISGVRAQGVDAAINTQNFTAYSSNGYSASKSNAPMNHFSGQFDLVVPLYQKKMAALDFSVSLSYLGAGGIKADDPGSIVGRGWKLNCGGMILRHKRGLADDNIGTGIIFNQSLPAPGEGEILINNGTPLEWYASNEYDAQHDVFEFSFSGRSGKFYIGKDKTVLQVRPSKLKIIPDITDQSPFKIKSFQIIDEKGVKYYFNSIAEKSGYGPTGWMLTSIVSPFDEESIKLDYYADSTEKYRPQPISDLTYLQEIDGAEPFYNTVFSPDAFDKNMLEINIRSVAFSDSTKILFTYSGGNQGHITEVKLKTSSGVYVPYYKFSYQRYYRQSGVSGQQLFSSGGAASFPLNYLFYNTPTTMDYLLYLSGIHQSSVTNTAVPYYSFQYYLDFNYNEAKFVGISTNMYPKDVDIWGYHNGKVNMNLIGNFPDPYPANRSIDTAYTRMGALKKITFPGGGTEEFFYEANDKKEPNGTVSLIGGIRVKKRIVYDGVSHSNDQVKEYRYIGTDGKSSGFLGDQPVYTAIIKKYSYSGYPAIKQEIGRRHMAFAYAVNPLTSVEGAQVGYRRVVEASREGTEDNGKTVYEFSDLSYINSSFWESPDYYPYLPATRPGWAVGLPVKTSYYKAGNVLEKTVENQYNITAQKNNSENFRSLFLGLIADFNGDLARIYKTRYIYPVTGDAQLIKTTETFLPSGGAPAHVSAKEFTYSPVYNNLTTISEKNYKGETLTTRLYYPYDRTESPYLQMVTKNILSPVVQTNKWIQKAAGPFLIDGTVTEYSLKSGGIRPSSVAIFSSNVPVSSAGGNPKVWVMNFGTYDNAGRLLDKTEYEVSSSSVFDKQGNRIALFTGSNYNTSKHTSFEDTESMEGWTFSSSGLSAATAFSGEKAYNGTLTRSGLFLETYTISVAAKGSGSITINGSSIPITNNWKLYTVTLNDIEGVVINSQGNMIDEVRISLPQTKIVTSTFAEGKGVTSTTDEAGNTLFYKYDDFYRLKSIRDRDGNIKQQWIYNLSQAQ